MLIITVQVNAPAGQAIGIKEDLAMYLERWGDARVVSVEQRPQPQMVKTAAGKSMPCDPRLVPYWERPGAAGKVVLQRSGKVVSCDFEGPRDELTGFGYISHFSTCPQARGFRRKR